MRFFDSTLTSDDAAAAVHRYTAREAAAGFCMWAMERVSDGVFLGLAGLQHVPYDAPFTPAVEIGWRLARAHWGRGYATEAARASLDYGFGTCGLREVVAVAVAANIASVAVMERVGMRRDTDGDFDHPALREGHPLRRHAFYRVTSECRDAPGDGKSGEDEANG